MGRPTKLTPARHDVIIGAIRLGVRYEVAAAAADVTDRSLLNWRNRGRTVSLELEEQLADMDPDERGQIEDRIEADPDTILDLIPEADRPYFRFFLAVTRAKAEWERGAVTRIEAAALPQDLVTEKFDGDGTLVERTVKTTPGDWRAEAFILERRYPQHWARTTKIEGGARPVEVSVALRERGRELVARIAERDEHDTGGPVPELEAGDSDDGPDG